MFSQLLIIQLLIFPTWGSTIQVGSISVVISTAMVLPMNGNKIKLESPLAL
jgi:hypothetical protein